MTRAWGVLCACVMAASGCNKQRAESTSPSDAARGDDDGSESSSTGAKSTLPETRDRDPDEEKRKMAQSRARSAEARKLLQSGDRAQAVERARDALKIHEQNVDAMMVLGEVFYREGKYELVVSVTSTALAVDERVRTPEDTSRVYNLQGFALASLGKQQSATQSFRKSAEADDKNAAAWNNLGTRYLRAGDAKTAESCFSYAVELEPKFAKAHLNHGAALRALGKLDAAKQAFDRALNMRPGYAEAHFNLGLLYLDAPKFGELSTTQRLERAISHLERYKAKVRGIGTEPRPRDNGTRKRVDFVSPGRADDYIRLARKGIEREERRAKRKAELEQKAADKAATDAQSASDAGANATPSASPSEPANPTKDGAQGTGGSDTGGPGASGKAAPQQPQTPRRQSASIGSRPGQSKVRPAGNPQPTSYTKRWARAYSRGLRWPRENRSHTPLASGNTYDL